MKGNNEPASGPWMACLVLITENPVPFARNVFYPNGDIKTFETEELANQEVWPNA